MNKKIVAGVVVGVLVVVGAGYFIYQAKAPVVVPEVLVVSEPKPTSDHKNASYDIDGKSVTLINGRAESALGVDSADKLVTQYFGNEVRADFNDDGHEDVAFLLTQNSGGSGTFYYVAVWLSVGDAYKGTNAILLGDRIAPQTTEWLDGEIVVNYAERKAGEAMTVSPSVGVSRYFQVADGVLIERKLAPVGTGK